MEWFVGWYIPNIGCICECRDSNGIVELACYAG